MWMCIKWGKMSGSDFRKMHVQQSTMIPLLLCYSDEFSRSLNTPDLPNVLFDCRYLEVHNLVLRVRWLCISN